MAICGDDNNTAAALVHHLVTTQDHKYLALSIQRQLSV